MNDPEPQKTEKWTIDHPQGCISEYRQGGKTVCKLWYPDGTLEECKTYMNGKLEGEFLRWHDNGQLCLSEFYKDGKLEGERKTWILTGEILDREMYHLGLLDGTSWHWFYNGPIHSRISYRNGNIDGECKQYGMFGDLRRTFYRNNIPIIPNFTSQIEKIL